MSQEEIRVAMEKEFAIPFNLSSPPFLRSAIAPVAPGHNVVMVLMHHIVMDGWSMSKVWSELMDLYKSIITGGKMVLAELPLQYSDFAAWERKQLEPGSDDHNKLVTYWKSQLQYATPVIQLPFDYPRNSDGGKEPIVIGIMVKAEMVSKLKAVAAKLKISLYGLCLAAFRLLLCEFSANDDVIISTTYSIRPPGTEDLIGYFLRMLLLRNRLEEGDSFASLAQREMNTLTGAIDHSILPLQDVIKVSDLPRAPGRTTAWQASITWDEEGKSL
jgi:Condensation domain